MEQFKVDYKGVIKLLLKFKIAKPKRLAGLYAVAAPVIWLYNGFYNMLLDRLYELAKTSQVVHIKAVLNDRWDAGLRRIDIIDGSGIEPLIIHRELEAKPAPYVYKEDEGQPLHYIYRDEELNTLTVDFIVRIPEFIVFDLEELKALVDKYRLPGKVYLVETF